MDELRLPLEFYTEAEAAKYLNTSVRNINSLIQNGSLEVVDVAGKQKITKASLDEVLPNELNEPNPDKKMDKNPAQVNSIKRELRR